MSHSSAAFITPVMTVNNEKNCDDVCFVSDDDLPFAFPQPKPHLSPQHDRNINLKDHISLFPYRYLRFEKIESVCDNLTIQEGTLCWVLLSQGKNRTSRLFKPARVLRQERKCDCDRINDDDDDDENHAHKASFLTKFSNSNSNKQDPRFLVQYPKGSTYWVRQSNLIPVLEYHSNLVIVTAETTDYRRTAIVHTTVQDHFIEIGCDFGILVDLVQAKTSLGIDKSETSIHIAKTKYPTKEFLLKDIFAQQDHDDIDHNHHCQITSQLPYPDRKEPLVVAIDINGNRELPAVLRRIELVLTWSPRLIIVKSRALYAIVQ
jgi:hypothetical protein